MKMMGSFHTSPDINKIISRVCYALFDHFCYSIIKLPFLNWSCYSDEKHIEDNFMGFKDKCIIQKQSVRV